MKSFKEIKTRINTLTERECMLFNLFLLRGIIPNYAFFSRTESFGNISTIIEIYKLGITSLSKEINENLEKLEDDLFLVSPDSEEYPSVYSTYALDVCSICYDIISILKGNDYIEAALRSSEISENTVYIFTLETLQQDKYDENEVYSNSLLLKEIERQEKYLQLVKGEMNNDLINTLYDIPRKSIIELS